VLILTHASKDEGTKENSRTKKNIGYMGFFSIMLSIAIVTAGVCWEIYALLPQYYIPLSFLVLAGSASAAFLILSTKIDIR
jgi:hypothetical protein